MEGDTFCVTGSLVKKSPGSELRNLFHYKHSPTPLQQPAPGGHVYIMTYRPNTGKVEQKGNRDLETVI